MYNWRTAESLHKPLEIDRTLSKQGVYIRKNIQEVETENGIKYIYDECFLDESYLNPALSDKDYSVFLLNKLKYEFLIENESLLKNKKTIGTSIGEFSIKTPTYDFIFCVMALKELPTGISEGIIRFYDGTPAPALTQEQLQNLYVEIIQLTAAMDAQFVTYKTAIEQADSIASLFDIEIVY